VEPTPQLVPLRRVTLPGNRRLVRLQLPDRPGRLARVATCFAEHGVDVLRIEVVAREHGHAVDDLLVAGGELESALAELAPEIPVLAVRTDADLPDPGLAMARACAEVAFADGGRDAYIRLVRAATGLVFADAAAALVASGHMWLGPAAATVPELPVVELDVPSLLRSALESGEPLTADRRAPWAPEAFRARLGAGSVAAVPSPNGEPFVLVLVRHDDTPFVQSEVERLAALVHVASGIARGHSLRPRSHPLRLDRIG
jgi:hypothetical protein